jgi:XTP/dITP diphosphohydrolase
MSLSLPAGTRLIAATHNAGKAKEISTLLDGRFLVLSAKDVALPEPEETETSFIGNAILKARHACDHSGEIALADDSGLSIDALNGDPGVYSARWAGPERDFARAMEIIFHKLEKAKTELGPAFSLRAHFTSALAVAFPDGATVVVEGKVFGQISFPARGDNGFGYDPIFVPDGYDKTFAEMNTAQKDGLSHRYIAFEKLKAALF